MRRVSLGLCTTIARPRVCTSRTESFCTHVTPHDSRAPHNTRFPGYRRSCSSSAHHASLRSAPRYFHSGLDDSRVRRLRQSGVTINKPRGRDNLSRAFESRLRICKLSSASELYANVTHPCQRSTMLDRSHASKNDPTHSEGSAMEQRRASSGDERMRNVLRQKRATEQAAQRRTELRIVVVYPLTRPSVDELVEFPSEYPGLYSLWQQGCNPSSTNAMHAVSFGTNKSNKHDTRCNNTRMDAGTDKHDKRCSNDEDQSSRSHDGAKRPCTSSFSLLPQIEQECPASGVHLPHCNRNQLCCEGDTTLLLPPVHQCTHSDATRTGVANNDVSSPDKDGDDMMHSRQTFHTYRYIYYTVLCVEPCLNVTHYYSMEAQIELMTAYRNILYEAAELPQGAADVVRIPVLACDSCGTRLSAELDKLSQQSIIKAFHRLSNEARECLITNPLFTVELYTPPSCFERFRRTFLTEPWATPMSILRPQRTALYPGLPPPASLLHDEGWVGGREELVTAVATEGRSLLRGPHYGLDGNLIEEEDVMATRCVFGARKAELRMLEAERASTRAALDELHSGAGVLGSVESGSLRSDALK